MRQIQSIRMILGTLVILMIANTAFAQRGYVLAGSPGASSSSTDKGFLFIDGEYVPPPYAITLNEAEISINGTAFTAGSFDLSSYQGRGPGMRRGPGIGNGRRGGGPSEFGPNGFESNRSSGRADSQIMEAEPTVSQFAMRRLFQEFDALGLGAIIVLRSDAKPMMLWPLQSGNDLLEQLIAISGNQTREVEFPASVINQGDRDTWRQLIRTFQSTPMFIERASQQVDEYNQARTRNEGQLASKKWSNRLSYPLTMLALILVVVAVGHLMANAQATFSTATSSQESSELSKNVVRLLVIVALMSAIDLVWTVMAHQSGSMRELNPIGSKLMNDPAQLIAFKLIVTGTSIGLLFWLRHLPLTRKATWWCCLTLTLLTARWLTFHSMLV